MKKRLLSLALALILIAALAVPAAAAEVTPAGYTLFRLSEKPLGGYLEATLNFLVVEDGTRLTCPGAEMRVTRYGITKAGGNILWSLDSYLQGTTDEDWDPGWEESAQMIPAGQALSIEDNAAYVVKAAAGKVSEELRIINRSTMATDAAGGEEGMSYVFLDHETPSGLEKLVGFEHILTTDQPLGYGYIERISDVIIGEPPITEHTDVCCIFPEGAMVYAPEGYRFTYGYWSATLELGGWSPACESGAVMASSDTESYVTLYSYGNPEPEEHLNLVWSGYGGNNDYSKWSLIRLSEEQMTSRHQCASAWALEPLEQAIDAGLMTFGDYKNLQNSAYRSEFAALVVRMYEMAAGKAAPLPETDPFVDYPDENMLKAYALGVIGGVGDGRMDPSGELTREQAATILTRLAAVLGYELPKQALAFDDAASVSTWAADAVGSLSAAGIMNGVGGNRFDPKGVYSSEQAVLTVMRMYELVKN